MAFFLLVAVWEKRSPRRKLTVSKKKRWYCNLGLIFLNSIFLKIAFPIAAMGMAVTAQQRGWGIFNYFQLPTLVSLFLSLLILDFSIYLQHVIFHTVPILWRLHMIHHTDLDIDISTGVRFHPIEIFLSMLIKMAVVAAIGSPVLAVLVFEITLNATAMFNHGNIYLPRKLDRSLRLLLVTPDMHRVHHSVIIRETNSNYGFNFPWWDRIFQTYRAQPMDGHTDMTIGISQFRKTEQVTFLRLLLLPFLGKTGRYSPNFSGKDPKDL